MRMKKWARKNKKTTVGGGWPNENTAMHEAADARLLAKVLAPYAEQAKAAIEAAKLAGHRQPVAVVLRLEDPVGQAMAVTSGVSRQQMREWAMSPKGLPDVVSAVDRDELIKVFAAVGHDTAQILTATANGSDAVALVGHGRAICVQLSATKRTNVGLEETPDFTGEIAVYEGPEIELSKLVAGWDPVRPPTFPALCLTPDRVLRLVTTDMLAPESVALAETAVGRIAAYGERAAFFSQRLAPGRRDDHGVRLGILMRMLGPRIGARRTS